MDKPQIALSREKVVSLYPGVDGDCTTDTNNELLNDMLDHDRRTILGPFSVHHVNDEAPKATNALIRSTAKAICQDGHTDPVDDLWEAIPHRDQGILKQNKELLKEWYSRTTSNVDPTQNPLLRIINTKHLPAAISLFRRMTNKPEWQMLLEATRSELHTKRIELIVVDRYTGNTILHELARIGFCSLLESILDSESVNAKNVRGQTALHIAAEHGRTNDVELLLNCGAVLAVDNEGCTPLHSVCTSKDPSCEVAKVLVKRFNSQTRGGATPTLNAKTKVGRNTALHLAAGNVNATEKFIEELADMNPTIPNANNETPFHVAAASTSSDNIMVAMLRTFSPNNRYCSVGDDDREKDKSPKELIICAQNGNARAVAFLIQSGAALTTDVLHVIVQESVKSPAKLDGLIAVYYAIVANVVPWWSAFKGNNCPLPDTDEYYAELFEAMMYLTSWTEKDKKNVIELAIDIGAGEMLIEILNTTHVYREDLTPDNNETLVSKYLVTDMINVDRGDRRPIEISELTETKLYRPKIPYLSRIIGSDKCWRDRSLLKTQPFLKLTQPMLFFARRLWFYLGVIQLIYMLCFSAICLPTRCSLAVHFRYNFTDCNLNGSETATNPSFGLFLIWPLFVTAVMSIWYAVHFINTCRQRVRNVNPPQTQCKNADEPGPSTKQGAQTRCEGGGQHYQSGKRVAQRRCKSVEERGAKNTQPNKISQFLYKHFKPAILDLLSWILDKFATIAFCVSVFVWFYMYTSRGPGVFPKYIESTSMVFLFGWIMTFSLFSGMSKKMHMFSLVLNEIIIKDIINNFLPIYVFVIIGFGFAVHTLRQTTLPLDDVNSLNTTVFQVFLAGLTITVDTLINGTDATYYANGGRYGFYRVVYAAFVCFTVIVLLNVLIAMLGNRYSKAKVKAENVWRYSSVQLALTFYQFFHRFHLWGVLCEGPFCSLCCCCFGAESRAAATCHCCSGEQTNGEREEDQLTVTMTVGVNPKDNVMIGRQMSRDQTAPFRSDSIPAYISKYRQNRLSAMTT